MFKFFINQIISSCINHEFFLEKRVQYIQFVFWYPRWLNLKVISRLLKDSMLVDLVKRTKFEDVSNFLLQVAEEFVSFFPSSPLLSFCLLTLACIVVYFKDTYLRVFWTMYSRKYFRLVVVEVYPCHPLRGFSYDPVARYVVLTIFIVRNRLSVRPPSISWVNLWTRLKYSVFVEEKRNTV